MRQKFRQKYSLFMQDSLFSTTYSLFYEKRIDTAKDQITQAKHI